MAPEQHLGRSVDARSDQFSFCVTLWELIFGSRPFEVRSRAGDITTLNALGIEVVGGRIRAPQRPHHAPAWLEAVLRRGLEVDPEARFATMDDLLTSLDYGRRRPRLPAVVAVLVLAIVAVTVAATVMSRSRANHGLLASDEAPRRDAVVVGSPPGDVTIRADTPLTPLITLSPDASRLAFVMHDRATVVDTTDGRRFVLAAPDDAGFKSAFFATPQDVVLTQFDADGPASLVSWNLAGTEPTPLARLPSPAACPGSTAAGLPVCLLSATQWGVLEGDRWRKFDPTAAGEGPAFSPDRMQMAFVRAKPVPAIVVIDITTGKARSFDRAELPLGMAWLDSERVLYGSLRDSSIHELDLSTGATKLRRARNPDLQMLRPLAVRSANRLLALAVRGRYRTRVLELGGTNSAQYDLPPSLQPLGWTTSGLIARDAETSSLVIYDIRHGHRTPLTELPAHLMDTGVTEKLFLAINGTGSLCHLTAWSLEDGAVRWQQSSPCNSQLACSAEGAAPCLVITADPTSAKARTLDLADGRLGPVVAEVARNQYGHRGFGFHALSPDGAVLATIRNGSIQFTSLNGSKGRLLELKPERVINDLTYGPDGSLFAIASDTGTGQRSLLAVNLSDGSTKDLWNSLNALLLKPRVSTTGREIAFLEMVYQQDLVEADWSP